MLLLWYKTGFTYSNSKNCPGSKFHRLIDLRLDIPVFIHSVRLMILYFSATSLVIERGVLFTRTPNHIKGSTLILWYKPGFTYSYTKNFALVCCLMSSWQCKPNEITYSQVKDPLFHVYLCGLYKLTDIGVQSTTCLGHVFHLKLSCETTMIKMYRQMGEGEGEGKREAVCIPIFCTYIFQLCNCNVILRHSSFGLYHSKP